VADLGIQAAEAIEHAHGLGVVHRDIKPANILIDHRGTLWITDFGLARLRNDSGLTMTGDLMGTLRYMSPEQAMGRAVDIDHRTDIYSLAVTLYELMTRRPAITGQDRQEVLRQIADDEPIPPRRLEPAIPRELETIILKAMNKEPASRYATAQELADDLRRFLEHKPIKARRPALPERAAKWARRHTAVVVSAVVLLIITAGVLAVSTVLLSRKEGQVREQRDRAEQQRAFAEQHARQARRAVDTMYTRVANKWLADQPKLTEVQREFLEEALTFYQGFARQQGRDPDVRREAAAAYDRVGSIHAKLGRMSEAITAHRGAVELRERLAAESPDRLEDQSDLAVARLHLGNALAVAGRPQEAEDAFRRAVAGMEAVAARAPDRPKAREILVAAIGNLAAILNITGRTVDAQGVFRRGLDLVEQWLAEPTVSAEVRGAAANLYHNLGNLLGNDHKLQEASDACRRSLELWEKAVTADPSVPDARYNVAMEQDAVGILLCRMGQFRNAEEMILRAQSTWKGLVVDFPERPTYRIEQARGLLALGTVFQRLGRSREAEGAYRGASAALERVVVASPGGHEARSLLGLSLRDIGELLRDRGDLTGSRQALQEALDHLRAALKAMPGHPAYRSYLEGAAAALGETLVRLGRHDEAARIAEELAGDTQDGGLGRAHAAAILVRCAVLARREGGDSPGRRDEAARRDLGRARALLAEALRLGANDAEALAAAAELLATGIDPEFRDAGRAVELAQKAGALAPGDGAKLSILGLAHLRAGDPDAAIRAIEKAMELQSGGDASDWFVLAMAHAQKRERGLARRWYERAVEWMEKNKPHDDQLQRSRDEAAALLGLADKAKSAGKKEVPSTRSSKP
jgi:tetratricopeptide (TPR) repeat protein